MLLEDLPIFHPKGKMKGGDRFHPTGYQPEIVKGLVPTLLTLLDLRCTIKMGEVEHSPQENKLEEAQELLQYLPIEKCHLDNHYGLKERVMYTAVEEALLLYMTEFQLPVYLVRTLNAIL